MKIDIRRGSWIVTLPLVAAAVAYVTLVFLPGRRAIAETRRQIEQKQNYLTQSAGSRAALLATAQELSKTRDYIAAWDRRAPSPGHRSALHGKIDALAKAAGAATTRFDPEPAVPWAAICKIPLTVGCSGSFGQICDFMEGLERVSVEVWIESVNIEKPDMAEGFVTCEIELVIFTNNPEISDYAEDSE